jgi:hypothetical protein
MERALYLAPVAALALLSAFHAGRYLERETRPVPVLIGHYCAGAGGDLFAMEESDFPPCLAIERNR